MQAQDLLLFQAALGLSDPWQVRASSAMPRAKRLHLRVDFAKGARFPCPECERADCAVKDTEEKTWRPPGLLPAPGVSHSRDLAIVRPGSRTPLRSYASAPTAERQAHSSLRANVRDRPRDDGGSARRMLRSAPVWKRSRSNRPQQTETESASERTSTSVPAGSGDTPSFNDSRRRRLTSRGVTGSSPVPSMSRVARSGAFSGGAPGGSTC